jgi:hypothetical protein
MQRILQVKIGLGWRTDFPDFAKDATSVDINGTMRKTFNAKAQRRREDNANPKTRLTEEVIDQTVAFKS